MNAVLTWGFLVLAIGAVVAFVAVSVRSARNLEESLQPPDDLRRTGDGDGSPNGWTANGGPIWPEQP